MANNRMIIACNKCCPTDDFTYEDFQDGRAMYMAKWYPVGQYYCAGAEALYGEAFYKYLEIHAHSPEEDGQPHQENPVRLTYETWVRDMPAIKKWEMPQHQSTVIHKVKE